jgi:multidrug resistance efflux pump
VTKGQTLATLASTQIRLALLEAEAQLAILERQIVEARAEGDAAAMNRAAIERESVRANVIKARADLTQVVIKSPMDGMVLTPKPQELSGRVFAVGDEVLRLADPKKMVILVHIPETDLLDVEIGQKVRCVVRAQPGQYFTGKVRHIGRSYEIPSTALDSSVDLEDEESKTGFIAEVEVTDAPFELRPGMTGQALIHAEKTSVMVRVWRRISNFIAFNFGL